MLSLGEGHINLERILKTLYTLDLPGRDERRENSTELKQFSQPPLAEKFLLQLV